MDQRSPQILEVTREPSNAAQHFGDFLDAGSDSAMQLADSEHVVTAVAPRCASARNMRRLPERYGDAGHYAADLPLVAYYGCRELVVHAVLAVDDKAVRGEESLYEVA